MSARRPQLKREGPKQSREARLQMEEKDLRPSATRRALLPMVIARGFLTGLVAFAAMIAFAGVAAAADHVARGSFQGASGHVTLGGVTVEKTAEGYVLVLEDDFSFDGAPDPQLGLGKGGYDGSTRFSKLKSNSGKQSYTLPAGIDASQYDEVWVWCEKFSVPLGVAKLN